MWACDARLLNGNQIASMKTDYQATASDGGSTAVATRSLDSDASARITVQEIARRLTIGRIAVYKMLEQRILPGVRVGRRWIITRRAYEQWERTCGMRPGAGLTGTPEVMVLN
jgi:excisionase family DNA binding protein